MVNCTRTTQRVSTDNLKKKSNPENACEKGTILHYIVNNFTNRAPPPMNNSDVIYDVKYAYWRL